MRRVWVAGLALSLAVVAPASATDPTWVGVTGPADWQPVPGYSLEIGSTAWTVDANNGGGLVMLDLQVPTIVRVRRLPDCVPIVRFVAQPGRAYTIRFAIDGSARVEDLTGQGIDTPGPPGDPGPLTCPRLPDTSTAPAPSLDYGWALGLLVWGVIFGVLQLARRSRVPPRLM